jgi:hypothetical protein
MTLTTFHVQTAAVLALVLLVGWPKFAPAPDLTVWRSDSPIAPRPELIQDEIERRTASTAGRSGRTKQGQAPPGEPRTLADIDARVNAIVGRARTLTNQPVPFARVVLRNTKTGFIEARTTADQEGRFTFRDVGATGYVIELIDADGTVIASSDLITIRSGDMTQATIRVVANSTVRAVFGSRTLGSTVQEAVTRAIDSGTRAVAEPTQEISPSRF